MKKHARKVEYLQGLRAQAEAKLKELDEGSAALTPEEAGDMVHELRTHQIELEMQNEELRRTRDELTEMRDRYADLYDFSPVGYVTIGEDGLIREANLTSGKMLGMERKTFLGKPISSFIHDEDQDTFYLCRKTLLASGTKQACELRIRRKDGNCFWARLECVSYTRDAGTWFRAAIIDIADEKEAEAKLRLHSEKLETTVDVQTEELHAAREQLVRKEKLAVLGQLAGSVGHELRGPLAVINNALYLLRSTIGDEDKTRKYLDTVAMQVKASEKIIADLLNLSRTPHAERLNSALEAIIGTALDDVPPPNGISIIKHITPGLPHAFVDPQQIDQALRNIIRNAYDAMPGGGTLTIGTSAAGNEVRIAIADTGGGISREVMATLFEPLYTTKPGGIGLGLTVSRNLVEINGGRIEVESVEGKGSTFTVVLPAEEKAP